MHSTTKAPIALPAQDSLTAFSGALAGKADLCDRVLVEARRLLEIGGTGTALNQLVLRACEVLDDMDEILVALHPARDAREFAKASELHRALEYVQAAMRDSERGRSPGVWPTRAR